LAASRRISEVLLPSLETLERVHEGCETPAEEIVTLEAAQTEADNEHNEEMGPLRMEIATEERILTDFNTERTKLLAALRDMDKKIKASEVKVETLKTRCDVRDHEHRSKNAVDRAKIISYRQKRDTANRDVTLLSVLKSHLTATAQERETKGIQVVEAVLLSQTEELAAWLAETSAIKGMLKENPAESSCPSASEKRARFLKGLLMELQRKSAVLLAALHLLQGTAKETLSQGAQAHLKACLSECRRLRVEASSACEGKAVSSGSQSKAVAIIPEACDLHVVPKGHPETPARTSSLRVAVHALGAQLKGLLEMEYSTSSASLDTIALVHPQGYIDAVLRSCRATPVTRTWRLAASPDTYVGPGSEQAILAAAGAVCRAVDLSVLGKRVFCAVRPPGHGVGRWGPPTDAPSTGFGVFNNTCIGIAHARLKYPWIERVCILDLDLRYGAENWGSGTHEILSGDEEALCISIHRGDASHVESNNLLTLPVKDKLGWRSAVQEKAIPKLDAFKPQLVMMTGGFDWHPDAGLPGSSKGQGFESNDFHWVTQQIVDSLPSDCLLVSVLEGGYCGKDPVVKQEQGPLESNPAGEAVEMRGLVESAVNHVAALCGAGSPADTSSQPAKAELID